MADKTIQVLLIQQSPTSLRLLGEMLSAVRHPPFASVCVDGVPAGLERLATEGVDVVLLDVGVPNLERLDTLRKVYAHAQGVPIVVVVDLEDDRFRLGALQNGAQDCLVKSTVNMGMLTRVLRSAVERHRLLSELEHRTRQLQKDITERKRVEEELRRQREARARSEKMAAMGSMLAGVAHELNNPLAVVLGHLEILRRTAGDGSLTQRVDKIGQAAQRCARIVKNFLALARQQPTEYRRVQLSQVVEGAVELLAYQLRVDNVEVTRNLAKNAPVLWADPHQLHQVVVNLITNAHQAMHQSASPRRLTLTTRYHREQRQVSLVVGDTGPGIPLELRSRIFEPFFTTKP
ncbi:MAG: sensor histidine kinase, partial [Candidatus Methylomirabilia bacterium]